MKRIFVLFVVAVFAFQLTNAQMGAVTKADNLLSMDNITKAYEAIIPALTNEKSMNEAKTWFVMGKVYQAIATSTDAAVQALTDDPLTKSVESYKKSLELDDKSRMVNFFKLQAPGMQNICINKGVEGFNEKDYAKALKYFELSLEVGKFPGLAEIIDTSLMFNAGIAAYNAEVYEKAIEHFREASKYHYADGNPIVLIKNAYMELGDTISAIEALKTGMTDFPENNFIVIELVNYYLGSGKAQEALEYIGIAKEKDPGNASLYFAEGNLFEKTGDKDKAFASYTKATEIDPTYKDAYYNLGVMFYNSAVELNDEAMKITNNDEYAKAKTKIDEEFNKAVPYLEKALELEPDNITTMKTLGSLYTWLNMEEKAAEMKARQEKLTGQ
ncbi:MAG: tetratricopeptide repeat protein [Bacteroidales bacterium]|nr:tetratricopeptide repeat protein [Bacteroidales bacterium]